MLSDSTIVALFVVAAVFWGGGISALLAAVAALRQARLLAGALRALAGLLLLALGTLGGALGAGLQGYRAVTHEELAARISVQPTGMQRYTARFRFADGRDESFALDGDAIYVDAHILKWHPIANLLGLHTVYELDRVAGRYDSIDQERAAPRSIYRLDRDRPVDLFALRRRYALLAPLVDAEYGSASFVPVSGAAELELRVSTTGLLIRVTPQR